MMKLRLRNVGSFADKHPVRKWQGWHLKLNLFDFKVRVHFPDNLLLAPIPCSGITGKGGSWRALPCFLHTLRTEEADSGLQGWAHYRGQVGRPQSFLGHYESRVRQVVQVNLMSQGQGSFFPRGLLSLWKVSLELPALKNSQLEKKGNRKESMEERWISGKVKIIWPSLLLCLKLDLPQNF